ncbi:MAG: YARHG domain-containing protein [Lachnospiraceae bacterium]|nr:YARHG domain-containing protein [Lachnospiraceae bacterium]MDD7664167.1 YARHG domain-containing protein [Lachnospiraceae bacterium]MDY4164521.1 YARHG domain-containing protein [Lachnospiraceae bacterium]
MSDQSPNMPKKQKTGPFIAVIFIAVAAVLCLLLFFAAKKGIVKVPFLKSQQTSESASADEDSSSDESSKEEESNGNVEVINQEVQTMPDYTSYAGKISKSKTSSNDSSNDDSSDTEESDQDYIFPDSNDKSISKSDIEALSDEDLRIAINEIYARHGYTFTKSEDLAEYFASKDWYEADADLTDPNDVKLSKTEKKNLDKMSAERDKRKKDGTWPY